MLITLVWSIAVGLQSAIVRAAAAAAELYKFDQNCSLMFASFFYKKSYSILCLAVKLLLFVVVLVKSKKKVD